ncbi:MAG: ribokinase [Ignavibacteriota bacterium]
MKTNKIVVVGSLNIDLVTQVDRLPRAGETVSGGDLTLFSGGKGANQAFAAARLGARSAMIGEVGDDAFGGHLLDVLRGGGVDVSGVGRSNRSTGSACISVLPSGDNAIVISPGANATLTPEVAVQRLRELDRGDIVLLQLEIPLETVEAVSELAAARGAIAILDPAPARPLPSTILRRVAYLTPNQSEAALLLGEKHLEIGDFKDAAEAARSLLKLGPSAVLLKLGTLGCFVATDDFFEGVAAFPVDAVDSTGAGDTFNGAFAVGLSNGMPIPDAARFANAAAALSVTRPGAQNSIPTRSEVMAFLQASDRPLQEAFSSCS